MKRRHFLASAAAAALPLPSFAGTSSNNVLRYVPAAPLAVLDPIVSSSDVTIHHANYVFDTLYAVDSSFTPQPQMAAGHTVSHDNLTWTITLRDGLRFHDGAPVRAIDCVASLQRWCKRDSYGQILARAVDDWQALDDKTLRINLKQRFPLLLDVLAKVGSSPFVMPEHLARTDTGTQVAEIIGSGPLRFKRDEFIPGSLAVYEKFNAYVPRPEPSDWAAGGKIVNFDRIEWQGIPDASTASAALQSGGIDWWETATPDLVSTLKQRHDVVVDTADPTGFLAIIRFNTLQPPFDNPVLRRAVLHALHQPDYLALLGNGDDPTSTRECHSFFPYGTPYGKPSMPDPMAQPASIEAARKMVAEAGYADERIVIINPSDMPSISPLGDMTYDLLKRMGLNVELVVTDWATVVQRRANRGPVAQGGWSIFHTFNAGASMSSPMTNFTLRGQGKDGWFGWYDSARMEQLASAWLMAETPAEHLRIAADMQSLGLTEVPSVPLGQFFLQTAYRRNIVGVRPGPVPFPWGVRKT